MRRGRSRTQSPFLPETEAAHAQFIAFGDPRAGLRGAETGSGYLAFAKPQIGWCPDSAHSCWRRRVNLMFLETSGL